MVWLLGREPGQGEEKDAPGDPFIRRRGPTGGSGRETEAKGYSSPSGGNCSRAATKLALSRSWTNRAAARKALAMATSLEAPWQMRQTPSIPSKGAPPNVL